MPKTVETQQTLRDLRDCFRKWDIELWEVIPLDSRLGRGGMAVRYLRAGTWQEIRCESHLNKAENIIKLEEENMAITEENIARERTKREAIDEMLLKATSLARENDTAALRIKAILFAVAAELQRPERAARVGWLGEITDALEAIGEYLDDTAKVLEEVFHELASR